MCFVFFLYNCNFNIIFFKGHRFQDPLILLLGSKSPRTSSRNGLGQFQVNSICSMNFFFFSPDSIKVALAQRREEGRKNKVALAQNLGFEVETYTTQVVPKLLTQVTDVNTAPGCQNAHFESAHQKSMQELRGEKRSTLDCPRVYQIKRH